MGINGLLPLLKSIQKSCNLKKFEGKTLGVDAYGWLHRGTVACAMELAMGKPTRKFVDFAMHRVRMLQHFGVIPYIVFDGDYLPSKAKTEKDREKRREDSKRTGLELLNAGKTSQAYLEFQKAVDVTPEMARQLIDELRRTGVQYVVAPYEADAQMVYLERQGIIDGILSEDSDLLVFGAKCLLTKLDQYGNCIEINKADFCACKEITLTGWSDTEFRQMAILSGCDYLSSINNMGLKTAYRMVRKHKTIEKVVRMLQFDGKFHVPKDYLVAFHQAELTFLHQRVFCPKTQTLVFHTQPEHPIDLDNMPFIGANVDPKIAQGVAVGDLNPMTKLPIVVQARNPKVVSTNPWPTRARQERSVSSMDLKKGVSIETFFQPKRVPLAELDINLFTPSPTQQNALRRNPDSFMSSLANRPYMYRSSTEPELPQLPQSAPPRNRILRNSIRSPSISEPRPKRARLCADLDSVASPSNPDLVPSRFFAANAEPSPTAGRKAKKNRVKKQDITVFSDDSIEEAMLSLPDADGFGSTGAKKMSIFMEGGGNAMEVEKEKCGLSDSQDSIPGLSHSLSITSSAEQPPTPTETNSSATPVGLLKSRFAFASSQVTTPKTNVINKGLPTPTSSAPRPASKIPVPVKSNIPTPRAALTPLQRLGANAANRSKLPMTPPMTPVMVFTSKSARPSRLSKRFVPFPEVTQSKSLNAEPATIPLPPADEIENQALNNPAGSEDLIIHDSEGEDDRLSPSPEVDNISKISLGRFVYGGHA